MEQMVVGDLGISQFLVLNRIINGFVSKENLTDSNLLVIKKILRDTELKQFDWLNY